MKTTLMQTLAAETQIAYSLANRVAAKRMDTIESIRQVLRNHTSATLAHEETERLVARLVAWELEQNELSRKEMDALLAGGGA